MIGRKLGGIRVGDRHVERIDGAVGQRRAADDRLRRRCEDVRRDHVAERSVEVEIRVVVDLGVELQIAAIDVVGLDQVVIRDIGIPTIEDAGREDVPAPDRLAARLREVIDEPGRRAELVRSRRLRGQRTARDPAGDVGECRPRGRVPVRPAWIDRVSGEVPLEDAQAGLVLPFHRPHEVDPVLAHAAQDGGTIVVAVGAVDVLVIGVHLEPDEVIASDEVDHAAGGFAAVGHRGAVLEDLGARQCDRRDVRRVLGHPATVHEDQRLVGTDAAQVVVDRTDGRRPAEVVHLARRRAGNGQALGELERSGGATLLQRLGREDFDRQCSVDRRAPDEGAGHDDGLEFRRLAAAALRLLSPGSIGQT